MVNKIKITGILFLSLLLSLTLINGEEVNGVIKYNPGGLCSPLGNLQCSENMGSVMECNANGDYRIKEECDYHCGYDENVQAICIENTNKGPISTVVILSILLILSLLIITKLLLKKRNKK